MRFEIAAIIIALLPSLSAACASYAFCLCQNKDNSFNDAATKKACTYWRGNYQRFDDGRHYCSMGVIGAGIGGAIPFQLSNCKFRESCNSYGAAGDSNCWAKQ